MTLLTVVYQPLKNFECSAVQTSAYTCISVHMSKCSSCISSFRLCNLCSLYSGKYTHTSYMLDTVITNTAHANCLDKLLPSALKIKERPQNPYLQCLDKCHVGFQSHYQLSHQGVPSKIFFRIEQCMVLLTTRCHMQLLLCLHLLCQWRRSWE